ncbi:MAG TPA: hypothetical protein VNN09_00705 [Candidatus Competibacteraceae bacterium]|nr:hypothetical protein [Candidatus Competibacteraceae bacterium]
MAKGKPKSPAMAVTRLALLRRLLGSFWIWLGTAIVALLGFYASGVRDWLLPSPRAVACELREWLLAEPASGRGFAILVSDLAHDPDGRQSGHIAAALREQPGLEVLRTCRVLAIAPYGDQTRARAAAEAQGRQWLEQQRADLLLWGEVVEDNRQLRLWFLDRRQRSRLRSEAYALERAELPPDFSREFAEQLVAMALLSLSPAAEQAARERLALLRALADKLRRLLALPPPELTPQQRAALHYTYALAQTLVGEQAGEVERLRLALEGFAAALGDWPRRRFPEHWAMIQNGRGIALRALGEREGGAEYLSQALAAYDAALAVYSRERTPLDWAMVQNNRGNVLRLLGEREPGSERLEQAVAAFRAALTAYDRDAHAADWAMVQTNLGAALRALGERAPGTAPLEQAVAAYGEALAATDRARSPLDWAAAQNNLANTLRLLGQRQGDAATLRLALAACRAALEEWSRERAPLDWAAAQANLGNILRALAVQEQNAGLLVEALSAYQAALLEQTRERVPLAWAMTENGLGNTLLLLGLLEDQPERLHQAAEAYRGALSVFWSLGAVHYAAGVEDNLRRAEAALAQRR